MHAQNGQSRRGQCNGELTLHAVTRDQVISARVLLQGTTLTACGDFTLKQTDYGLRLVSARGGALKVKDEVKCSFHILAQKTG